MKALFATILAAIFLTPIAVFGCSCGRAAQSEAEFVQLSLDASQAVFLAEAVSIEVFPSKDDDEITETQRVRWKVIRSWKGKQLKDQIAVTETVITCCLCGVPANKGDVFLLFRFRPEPFSISSCSLSGQASNRKEQIALLDKLAK